MSSWQSKSRVRIPEGVIVGTAFLSPSWLTHRTIKHSMLESFNRRTIVPAPVAVWRLVREDPCYSVSCWNDLVKQLEQEAGQVGAHLALSGHVPGPVPLGTWCS